MKITVQTRVGSLTSNRPILEQFGCSWRLITKVYLVSARWRSASVGCIAEVSEIITVSIFAKMEIARISEISAIQPTVVLKHFQIWGDIQTFSSTNGLQDYK
jgi:hypothetical protein